jgi:acetoin utilization deacetylase AcuC-like enzyme
MDILTNKKFLNHNVNSNAEGSYRIDLFTDKYSDTEADGEEFITLVHSDSYKNSIKKACKNNETIAEVYLTEESWEAAKTAVGLTIKASEQCDFAVVRPPGHHAGIDRASGFCFFNNIAIAAQKLVNEGKRVFIFDFDGHHGDGTQNFFYKSSKVFYCSIHQIYTYPYTGFAEEKGKGDGEGYTLNLPMISGSGDMEFYSNLNKVISAIQEFKPDIIGVSAGFDAYDGDRLLSLKLSLKAFYECGLRLRRAFPKIFAVLEGGYHNDILKCVEAFVEGINIGTRPRKNLFDSNMSVG